MDKKIFASLPDEELSRLRDDLLTAHGQGAERIRFQDRDVTLRSLVDVEGLILAMNAELASRSGQPPSRTAHRGFTLIGRRAY